MLIENIDSVRLQALQCRLSDDSDALRAAVHAAGVVPLLEAELGRDHDLVANRRQCLTHDFLIGKGAIGLGRVEEGHAVLERRPNQRDRAGLIHSFTVSKVQPHAAEADGRDV